MKCHQFYQNKILRKCDSSSSAQRFTALCLRQYTRKHLHSLIITSLGRSAHLCWHMPFATCLGRSRDIQRPIYGHTWHSLTRAYSNGTLRTTDAITFNTEYVFPLEQIKGGYPWILQNSRNNAVHIKFCFFCGSWPRIKSSSAKLHKVCCKTVTLSCWQVTSVA